MDLLLIEQSDASEGQAIYLPMARIFKILKNDVPWGDENCLVKVFHDDGSGDAAIVILKGAATAEIGKRLGVEDDSKK